MARGRSYVRIEKIGDWVRCRDTLKWYERKAMGDIQNAINGEMEDAKDQLKSHIESGSGHLTPLSANWSEYKARHGLDPRVLIATGEYLDSFTVSRVGERTWMLSPVGHEELAGWLEYGTGDMPARPHWVFVNDKLPDRIRRNVKGLFRTKGGAL